MANKYNDILTLVNAGNQMGLSNTIKRDYGIPLDFTSVQKDYDEAVKYAATSTLAYVGQPVSVGDKLYIITETANGSHSVGGEAYDVYLAEVGSATEGDGNTIELDGKILKLAGLKGLDNSKTYVPSLVNGKLTWAEPDTSTAEGQAQEINALKARATALEATVNGVEGSEGVEGQEGLVDKVAENTAAIAAEVSAREAAIKAVEAKIPTDYVKTSDYETYKGEVTEALNDRYTQTEADTLFAKKGEDAYDDTALKAKVSAVETALGNVYTKDETYTKTEVNDAISGMSHFSVEIVESAEEMTDPTVLYLVHVESATGADKYNEYLVIGGTPTMIGDTTTDLSQYATKAELTAHVNEAATTYATKAELTTHANEAAETYATKSELEEHAKAASKALTDGLAGKVDNATLDNYYTKTEADGKYAVATEVNGALATKADKATTLSGYGITDAYTKTEVDNKIGIPGVPATGTKGEEGYIAPVDGTGVFANAYSKAEINDLLDKVSGGSSETAASVKRQLDEYKTSNNQRVADIEGKVGNDVNGDTPATGLFLEVDQAMAKAEQGVADAAAASAAVTALETGKVATNASDITAIKGRLDTLETAKGDHETRISGVEGRVTALEAEDEKINTAIGTIQGDITTLKGKDASIEGTITSIQTSLNDKADKTALETLQGNVYTKSEVDNLLATLDQTELEDAIQENKTAIENEVTRAQAAEAANKSLIDTLIGTEKGEGDALLDAGKSVRTIATEVIAGQLATAPEAFDTLIEMANWLDTHSTDVVDMDNRIKANETILDGFGGEGEPAKVKEYVDGAIAAAAYQLPVATLEALGGVKSSAAENKVSVAADGTMEVNSLNVNKLVQTEGEVFVLHGGSAEVASVEQ